MKLLCTLLTCALLAACSAHGSEDLPAATPQPSLPAGIATDDTGTPTLEVYVTDDETISAMDIETYVMGVVAGEMKNDWPLEALKAQAILARTFVVRFVSEKESRYAGADISTDIAEAQAYNKENINDRIRQAVEETAGQVLVTASGTLPYTWFHAHSGGTTALAREGLGWKDAEPAYTKVTEGLDSPDAPAEAKAWAADFPAEEFLAACRKVGADPQSINDISIYEKGDSGRAVTLMVDGEKVPAAELRIALGSTVMRSTLLTELSSDGASVHMEGRGYGHGVGMPQWGAYALAQDGLTGADIALHYYNELSLVKMW
ncbi:MAG: SpoIID/LytB domain-containing protein [Clostridia bacterium]|nr:SpoIID/LytB domain-containing protein [Clostridia bacterium]